MSARDKKTNLHHRFMQSCLNSRIRVSLYLPAVSLFYRDLQFPGKPLPLNTFFLQHHTLSVPCHSAGTMLPCDEERCCEGRIHCHGHVTLVPRDMHQERKTEPRARTFT